MRFETEMPAIIANLCVEETADGRFYLEGKTVDDTWKIGMNREQAVKTARALMKMTGEEEKPIMEEPKNNRPPLGTAPYFIQAGIRIGELGEAISRYSTTAEIHKIREWASEIILQCDLIREMKFNIKEDCKKEFERAQQEEKCIKRGGNT